MVIHKEYVLRRFCQVPLKNKQSKNFLTQLCADPVMLKRIVFVTCRDCLANTMVIAQAGSLEPGFELKLGDESEQLTLVDGGLKKIKHETVHLMIKDPLQAWEVLRSFTGILHVQLVFDGEAPDWYEEIAVVNESIPSEVLAEGFSAFIRDQVDLILWGITLKQQIDDALKTRNEKLFRQSVKLYKEVCESCFWKLS